MGTVHCGPPPLASNNGTRFWQNATLEGSDDFNTIVRYRCSNGSKFDRDNDGVGDMRTIQTRCLWSKTWSRPSLPSCLVTHCTIPPTVPEDTNLEDVNPAWTPIGGSKQYNCTGWTNVTHTHFWQTDRTRSTFEILCQVDGTYKIDTERSSWPTCLEGEL